MKVKHAVVTSVDRDEIKDMAVLSFGIPLLLPSEL
jgi:lipoate synthase